MKGRVLAALLLLTACGSGGDAAPAWPEVMVEDLATGEPTSSSALLGRADGRASVVTVWAVWCEPCRKELPALDDLARRRVGSVAVAGVNHGDDPQRARAFLDGLGVTFPSLRDPDGRLVSALGVGSLPATFVVDAAGVVVWRRLGVVTPSQVEAALDAALDGSGYPSS